MSAIPLVLNDYNILSIILREREFYAKFNRVLIELDYRILAATKVFEHLGMGAISDGQEGWWYSHRLYYDNFICEGGCHHHLKYNAAAAAPYGY